MISLPIVFFIVLAVSLLSSLFLLYPKVPLNYVRIHMGVISFPPILALFALIFHKGNIIWGPWQFNSLSWLLALFVLTMGLIVQRYSVHYLLGDRSYRKYFSLLTLTTAAGSLAWLSDDLRFLLICWGTTLLGLTLIIRLKKEWQVAKNAAFLMGRLFTISWFIFLLAILWLTQATGHWQLVGSTITQMGFMLIQCALGAYLAAIIHAVLHGLFKSTLFLQAGSAVHHDKSIKMSNKTTSLVGTFSGVVLGILAGFGYWLTSPEEAYQLISSIILGWSVSFAWIQLVAFGYGRIGRISGFSLFAGGAIVYGLIHSGFHRLLYETIQTGTQPPVPAIIFLLFILLAGSAIGAWLARNRSSKAFMILYLWLIRFGESKQHVVESHPKYLTQFMSKGDHVR